MLKYLLGIVTALACVAVFVIWTSLPGNFDGTGTGDPAADNATDGVAADGGTADGGTADGGTVPKAETGETDGDGTDGAATLTPGGTDGGTRGLKPGGGGTAAAATAPMRRESVPELGFGIDVPEGWLKLDAAGLRRYFSEYQGMGDQNQVDALVSTIVLATIRDWPDDGAVANVIINHRLAPRRDVLPLLNTMLEQKRGVLDAMEVVAPPTQGQLGNFWGASVRTRETSGTGDAAIVRESVVWILRIADGYMLISAEAPADDAEGLALIERMLGSVAALPDSG